MTIGGERGRSTESPRSQRQRESNRVETSLRARAVALVAVLLAGVLVAGSIVHVRIPAPPSEIASGELPSVDLASAASVEWECPGPLPAGASARRSSILISNPGQVSASVIVQVAAVRAGLKHAGVALPSWSTQLSISPHAQRVVPLRSTGPSQNDAVSVLSTAGSVGVFESVAAAARPTVRGKHKTTTPALPTPPQQSPCTTGLTGSSYLASGSTAGRSDVFVSLFNPTATEAVTAIRVSTGSAVISPPMLQGLIIKPYSLQVFDLARWVVQQATVAVAETTSVGRVALGASESVEADSTAKTTVTGHGLLIGIATPQDTWVMTPGLGQRLRTVSVRVYDPGPRAANVTISSPAAGRPLTEITATVPAGQVREILLPLPSVSSSKSGAKPAGLLQEGPIVVRSAEGVGVVVARIAVDQVTARSQTVSFLAGTADPSGEWLLPAGWDATITSTTPAPSSVLLICNPGSKRVDVKVVQLTSAGTPNLTSLTTVSVAAGGTATVALHLVGATTSFAGLDIIANGPVVAEQDYDVAATSRTTAAVAPAPVGGLPVTR